MECKAQQEVTTSLIPCTYLSGDYKEKILRCFASRQLQSDVLDCGPIQLDIILHADLPKQPFMRRSDTRTALPVHSHKHNTVVGKGSDLKHTSQTDTLHDHSPTGE